MYTLSELMAAISPNVTAIMSASPSEFAGMGIGRLQIGAQ